MTTTINHISLSDSFWIQFKEHQILFGFNWLPKDVHFAIAFNTNSPDINFHITKNISETNKIKIEIVRINKSLLEEITPLLTKRLFNYILQPLQLPLYILYSKKTYFLSFEELQKDQNYLQIEKIFEWSFKSISKLRGKRKVKIEGDIEIALRNIINSSHLNKAMNLNLKKLPHQNKTPIDSGVIFSKKYSGTIIRMNNQWFSIRESLNLIDLLLQFFDARLIKDIEFRTKRSIIKLKHSNLVEDYKTHNNYMRLNIIENRS